MNPARHAGLQVPSFGRLDALRLPGIGRLRRPVGRNRHILQTHAPTNDNSPFAATTLSPAATRSSETSASRLSPWALKRKSMSSTPGMPRRRAFASRCTDQRRVPAWNSAPPLDLSGIRNVQRRQSDHRPVDIDLRSGMPAISAFCHCGTRQPAGPTPATRDFRQLQPCALDIRGNGPVAGGSPGLRRQRGIELRAAEPRRLQGAFADAPILRIAAGPGSP